MTCDACAHKNVVGESGVKCISGSDLSPVSNGGKQINGAGNRKNLVHSTLLLWYLQSLNCLNRHTSSRRYHSDLALGWFLRGQCHLKSFFSLHHLLTLVLPFDLNVLPPGAEEFWQGQPPFPDHDSRESDDSETDESDLDMDYDLTDDSETDESDLDTDYDLTDDSETDESGSESSYMDCSEGTPP